MAEQGSRGTIVDADLLAAWPLPRPGADKEERGRLVVVAGGQETPGAGLLSAEAAFRAGAGKVHLLTPVSCAPSLAVAAPELRVTGLAEDDAGCIDRAEADRLVECAAGSSAVLLGPGLPDPDRAADLVGRVLPRLDGPVVLDALATAYVTGNHAAVADLRAEVVLTVNPDELAHCLGVGEDEVEADLATHTAHLARRTRTVAVCGGPAKVIAAGEDVWCVRAGNPGLGTAGSGDVHAGIVAGLLARGAPPAQAAVWGAYLHAVAGDRLAARLGPVGYLARELPGEVPGLLAALDRPRHP